ncbi:MAG: PIN domain protein [Pseudomonadota bacterium]|nr:PIN domain protein [Pseudomonadota bacterium]
MLIYLDICCFNRPFDSQGDLLVRLQTEAKLHVQEKIRLGKIGLAWSAVLDLENEANPDRERYLAIADWKALASVDVEMTSMIEGMADSFAQVGVKAMDALHVASAIASGAGWLLTTDKHLLKKLKDEASIKVLDPVDFVRVLQESQP